MDKITPKVRIEHWIQIMNECLNSGMSSEYSCAGTAYASLLV